MQIMLFFVYIVETLALRLSLRGVIGKNKEGGQGQNFW